MYGISLENNFNILEVFGSPWRTRKFIRFHLKTCTEDKASHIPCS